MAPPASRFRILDLMAIVALIAFGVFYAMAMEALYDARYDDGFRGWRKGNEYVASVALFVTLGLSMLRLMDHRVPLKRIIFEPGASACITVSITLLYRLALWTPLLVLDPNYRNRVGLSRFFYSINGMQPSAYGVIACWTVLLLGKRWRSSANRFDLLGRCLGIYWIVGAVLNNLFRAWI